MINRNVMGRSAEDEFGSQDLSAPPEAPLPVDPMDNSMAMLGTPPEGTGEVSPEMAGPAAPLAFMGMMAQGAEGLGSLLPGFVPMEIIAWIQGALTQLPQLIQQTMSGSMGGGMPGMGVPPSGAAPTAALGPSGASPQAAQPSGPPRPY